MDQKYYFLPTDFKETGPWGRAGKALNAIGRMLNGLHFINGGSVMTTRDFIRLRPDAPPGFSGVAYVAGNKVTGLDSAPAKTWVKCDANTGTASECYASEVVFPFPPNVEFYEKSKTYGDIHLPRL